ncbi:MAG: UvrD-helicase domain-containing protein, partial [Bacteroidota bacterium]|nr:UvrD-helicase domain-containing protein [Bacteroidota bacterium]
MSFTVYRSSAGSGKTYTLVKEYLRMILPEPEKFRNILAITFTNKAANEMKERVLANLEELAKPEGVRDSSFPLHLVRQLVNETGLNEIQIEKKAGEALRLILHNYSDFSIGTIDSFSNRIIRAFAHDFGLPVNFNVELDDKELLEVAVSLLFEKVGTDKELTAFLVRFLESRMDDEEDWNIEKIFLDFAKVLQKEDAVVPVSRLKNLTLGDFGKVAVSIRKSIRDYETKIISLGEKAIQLIKSHDIPSSAFFQKQKGIWSYFEKLARGAMTVEPGSNAAKTLNEGKWTSKDASSEDREKIGSIQDELVSFYQEIQEEARKNESNYYLLKALQKTVYPMAVLNEISNLLETYKKENNIVHISEFNRRIAGFIFNEPVPFIYERMGEKYHHILIDEFQDTSLLQWNNLLPLVENALAGGNFNLVVGDGKQAIYRWRNGDVSQFTSLPALPGSKVDPVIAGREKLIRHYFKEEKLDTNFRSREGIVNFNNNFFTCLRSVLSTECQEIYRDLEQKKHRSGPGGYVSVEFVSNQSKETKAFTLNRILEIIHELEEDHFRKQDIVILCRKKSEGSEIARFLTSQQVDVISAESLLLLYSPEVNFIAGFCRFLFHEDALLLAGLFRYLYKKGTIQSASLHELLLNASGKVGLAETFFKKLGENGIPIDPDRLKTLPLYDLMEEIIRVFNLAPSPDPYVQFFLDDAFSFQRKKSSHVPDFLEWWDEHHNARSIRMPDGMDAVRIMTIHKAKGLEFPAVIAPFYLDRKKQLTRKDLWVELPEGNPTGLQAAMLNMDKGLEKTEFSAQFREEIEKTRADQLNVLYVAMTRAEDRLYVVSNLPSSENNTPDSIPAFLKYYFTSKGEDLSSQLAFTFGERTRFEPPENKPGPNTVLLHSFSSSDWRKKILIRTNAPESWDMEDPQKNRKWGTLLHTILDRIDTAEDL